jgi:hypothetical protein
VETTNWRYLLRSMELLTALLLNYW